MYVCMYVYIYMYTLYVYIYIHIICICIYIYIHTVMPPVISCFPKPSHVSIQRLAAPGSPATHGAATWHRP